MTKHLTVRQPDDLAIEAEAVARAEGTSHNEAIDPRRQDPEFTKRLHFIVQQDRALLERLAK